MSLNKQSVTALKCKYITASVYMSGSSPWKYCYWYVLRNQLTNQLMKQSPHREDNISSSPSREISYVLTKPEGPLLCSQKHATCPCTEPN